MKSIVLSVLVLLAAAVSLCAAEGVAGKWQVHQSVMGNESDMTCTFTQTGEDLAGSCDGPRGTMKLTGKVEGKKVSWSVNSEYEGNALTITYSGTLAADGKMTGTLSVAPYGVEGEFTAALAK